ncbi:MAG: hypothetical protein ABJB12_22220 [Pseudomonadota bacterium]
MTARPRAPSLLLRGAERASCAAMFRGIWLAVALMGLGLNGCVSLAAASTGQVGCAQDQITISDDSMSPGVRTWTAECGGRRYFCSAVSTGNSSSQVNCAEERGPKVAAATPSADTGTRAGAKPPPVPEVSKEAPKGAAGFLFGATSEEASTVCINAGYEWKAGPVDHFSCSGTPGSIGFPATATVRFCADKLCAVALQVNAAKQWMSAYAKLSETLTQKYGTPATIDGSLGTNCQTEAELESCVMSGNTSLQRVWKWGASNHVSLGLTAGSDAPRLDLLYIHKSTVPVSL